MANPDPAWSDIVIEFALPVAGVLASAAAARLGVLANRYLGVRIDADWRT